MLQLFPFSLGLERWIFRVWVQCEYVTYFSSEPPSTGCWWTCPSQSCLLPVRETSSLPSTPSTGGGHCPALHVRLMLLEWLIWVSNIIPKFPNDVVEVSLIKVFSPFWPYLCWPCRGTWWWPRTGSSPCPPPSPPSLPLSSSGPTPSLSASLLSLAGEHLTRTAYKLGEFTGSNYPKMFRYKYENICKLPYNPHNKTVLR